LHKPVVRQLEDILRYNTYTHGLQELLRYADRNSMAHGREVRLPFLNHTLVEFALSLPTALKIHNGFAKWVLRTSMQPYLPANIVWRKGKVGYEPPQQQWMQHAKAVEMVHEARRTLIKQGVLKQAALNNPISATRAHDADNSDWRYLCAAWLI
jgi:asparagine synthase (glutamine-hydrolysing)